MVKCPLLGPVNYSWRVGGMGHVLRIQPLLSLVSLTDTKMDLEVTQRDQITGEEQEEVLGGH